MNTHISIPYNTSHKLVKTNIIITFCTRADQDHQQGQGVFPAAFIHPELHPAPSLKCLLHTCRSHFIVHMQSKRLVTQQLWTYVDTPAFSLSVWPAKQCGKLAPVVWTCFPRTLEVIPDTAHKQRRCERAGHFREILKFCNNFQSSDLCS